jgi:hypothetical protein
MGKKSTRMLAEEIKSICDKRNARLAYLAEQKVKREARLQKQIAKVEKQLNKVKGE